MSKKEKPIYRLTKTGAIPPKLLKMCKSTDHLRVGFCGTCSLISFIDPPGGPFTSLGDTCEPGQEEGCPYNNSK